MKVYLKHLDIDNFRGITKSLMLFDKGRNVIEAPFGKGKTTIYEAFLYVMGLPIRNIKPCRYENNRWVEIPNIKTQVSASLEIHEENEVRTLELVRKDNSTFEINDVKVNTLNAYQNLLLKEFKVDTIDLYSDLLLLGNFNNRELKVKRNLLLDITNAKPVLVKTQKSYERLFEDFKQGKTTEQIAKEIRAEIKSLESKTQELNTKQLTLKQSIQDYILPYEDLEKTKVELETEIANAKNDLCGQETIATNEFNRLCKIFAARATEVTNDKDKLNATLFDYKRQELLATAQLEKLKEELKAIEFEEIDEILVCPTCKTALSRGNALTKMVQMENEEKRRTILEKLQKQKNEVERLNKAIKENSELLSQLNHDYDLQVLQEKMNKAKTRMENWNKLNQPTLDHIKSLETKLEEVNKQLITKDIYNKQLKTLNDIGAEQKEVVKKIQEVCLKEEDLKHYLASVETITTDHVNSCFKDTNLKWQLYDNAKTNNNLTTILELLWKDKRYSYCSRGERLTADYELLYVLQKSYDLLLPIFIDNVGDLGLNVKDIQEVESQMILLKTESNGKSLEENIDF